VSVYTFIDGQYLRSRYETIMKTLYGEVPPIDFSLLTFGALKSYYYDAIDESPKDTETQKEFDDRVRPRRELHQYINQLANFHVREGYVRKGVKREQKAVDVMLAVDALEHAARGNLSAAHLVVGDLDFEPLVKSLVRLGVQVVIHYSPLSVSEELLNAADMRQRITARDCWDWTFNDFRRNNQPFQIASPPSPMSQFATDYTIYKAGKWNKRQVTVFKPNSTTSASALVVEQGKELLQDPITMWHNTDPSRLGVALELSFGGKVEWD
jgi:hypothetical protein